MCVVDQITPTIPKSRNKGIFHYPNLIIYKGVTYKAPNLLLKLMELSLKHEISVLDPHPKPPIKVS